MQDPTSLHKEGKPGPPSLGMEVQPPRAEKTSHQGNVHGLAQLDESALRHPLVDTGDEEQRHRPPISVIVVSPPAGPDLQRGRPNGGPSLAASSVYSPPFRLQPRQSMTISTPGRDGSIRGRKRSALTMSSKLGSAGLLTTTFKPQKPSVPTIDGTMAPTVAATPSPQQACGFTPPRDIRRGVGRDDNTMVNFQCLSLQSPKRKEPLTSSPKGPPSPPRSPACFVNTSGLHPTSSSSYAGAVAQHPATVPGSVGSFQSSFTPVFNAASPSGSMRSLSYSAAQSQTVHSNGGGSAKSSPKFAPLTVIQDRGARLPPGRDNCSRLLPPLSGCGMNSLWMSLESQGDTGGEKSPKDDELKQWPPRNIFFRKSSSDSTSSVHNHVLSPMKSSAFSSPASTRGPLQANTPIGKQRKLDEYASPSQRSPRTPRTPLPRVTLTPRSTGSYRSRRSASGLPIFPSPSEAEMDVTSSFLNSAAATTLPNASIMRKTSSCGLFANTSRRNLAAISSGFPASTNSLALSADASAGDGGSKFAKRTSLPMLDLSSTSPKNARYNANRETSDVGLSGGTYMGIQTMSLLNSSGSGGILQAMAEETAHGGHFGDMDSMSDLDEDEGFILAAPSTIEEERFASCQPARQRRRRSDDHDASRLPVAQGVSPSLPSTSNTNLAGMNNVTSSTSLFGMDIVHPTDHTYADILPATTPSLTHSCTPNQPGGALTRSQETQTLKGRKLDASFDSVGLAFDLKGGDGGRDLVTPPPMPDPETPPPLSPKMGGFGLGVRPENTVDGGARRQVARVCIAGADRKSVTMAIARMASEAGSSPVL